MSWILHTDELKSGFPEPDIALIKQSTLEAAVRVNGLKINDINVHFHIHKPFGPGWGVGANAPNANTIHVNLHPSEFYLRSNEHDGRNRFSAVLAHESHHTVRWQGPGYGTTLGEMAISEGLAMKFEKETRHPNFYGSANAAVLRTTTEKAKSVLDTRMGEDGQFRASDGSIIDRYALGLAIVEGWAKHTGRTAASAALVPAKYILLPWLKGEFDIVVPATVMAAAHAAPSPQVRKPRMKFPG